MKSLFKNALFAVASAAFLTSSAQAVVTYTPGDLLLGFRLTGDADTYVFNVGSSVGFRDNGSQGFIANINTDLTTAFGASWSTNPGISFSIVGVRSNSNANAVSPTGDPNRTVYASVGASVPMGSSAPVKFNNEVSTASTDITGYQTGLGGFAGSTETAGSNFRGAIIPSSNDNSYTFYNNGSTSFSTLGPETEATITGVANATHYLDLYRLVSKPNASPNPAPPAPGPEGQAVGSYETTFSLDSLGNINASAVPEPASSALLGLGAAFALLQRRRKAVTA